MVDPSEPQPGEPGYHPDRRIEPHHRISSQERVAAELAGRPPRVHEILGQGLSPREVEVMQLCAKGYKHKEVAFALEISTQTVKNHLSTAYRKLDVGSLQGALVKLGWVQPTEDQLTESVLPTALAQSETNLRRLHADIGEILRWIDQVRGEQGTSGGPPPLVPHG